MKTGCSGLDIVEPEAAGGKLDGSGEVRRERDGIVETGWAGFDAKYMAWDGGLYRIGWLSLPRRGS